MAQPEIEPRFLGDRRLCTLLKLSSLLNPSADKTKTARLNKLCFRFLKIQSVYLVGNLDEQGENDNDEQVVKNADSSDDDVDDFKCEVTDGP